MTPKEAKIKAAQKQLVEWALKNHPRKMKAYASTAWADKVRRASELWTKYGDA